MGGLAIGRGGCSQAARSNSATDFRRHQSGYLRGHGESDKPHESSAYLREMTIGDVFAVADAEGLDAFAIWGLSYGGWIAWAAADSEPGRVVAIVTTEPGYRPGSNEDWVRFDEGWGEASFISGMQGLIDLFKESDGAAHEGVPAVGASCDERADPLAMLAINSRELYTDGIRDLDRFATPALLIAGEFEDEDDNTSEIAAMLPHGESLRLPGLGHGGACAAGRSHPDCASIPRSLVLVELCPISLVPSECLTT